MNRSVILTGPVLGVALALAASACATKGKMRMSSQSMCEAHGGTYNAQTATCTPGTGRAASQACEALGGAFDPGSQFCEW